LTAVHGLAGFAGNHREPDRTTAVRVEEFYGRTHGAVQLPSIAPFPQRGDDRQQITAHLSESVAFGRWSPLFGDDFRRFETAQAVRQCLGRYSRRLLQIVET
jgi:hypothetical protein